MRLYNARPVFAGALMCGALMGLASAGPKALASDTSSLEYQLKAAFLYNFAKFVEWPVEVFSDTDGVFLIGILGEDPFGEALEKASEGHAINGHKIVIKRSRDPADLQNCQMLFISQSEERSVPEILRQFTGKKILTISDIGAFAQSGGVIGFIKQENKIRFEINTDAAAKANLAISSKLLNLAHIVNSAKGV